MKNLLLTGALLLNSLAALAQNILTVDNNPLTAAQYTDLQAAVDAASPGDFIHLSTSIIRRHLMANAGKDAQRVMVGGSTRLQVQANDRVSVGSHPLASTTPN